jgi:hypothetical protein
MGDLIYACVQLVHNLGAAAVVGSPAVAWWLLSSDRRAGNGGPLASRDILRRLAWLTLIAWSTQVISGAGFGTTTYFLKHELPDLTGIGLAALSIKISCAVISLVLALIYLRSGARRTHRIQLVIWQTLFLSGLAALMSAAFLRWYA